jgi:heptosyltransferase-3
LQILFISNTHIGDAVLSTGVLNYLVEQYPEASFTIVCGKPAAPLFQHVPRLTKLIILEKQRHSLHWWQLWKQCISTCWDMVVDLRRSIVAPLLIAKKRYIARRPAEHEDPHRQQVNARMLGLSALPPLKLWVSAKEKSLAEQLISESIPGHITIALAPMANWPLKMWPIEKYVVLVQRIVHDLLPNKTVSFALSCSPKERQGMQSLIDAIAPERCILLIDNLSLLDVAACFERCTLFIGNDSGLMHIANAMGVPTIGLFGPSKDALYGPLGEHAMAVRTPESFDALMVQRDKAAELNYSLMKSLSVDRVFSAVAQQLYFVLD